MKSKLFLFLILALISACKKDPYYPVSDEMKQYFNFQNGSYWIYKNDSTGFLDSSYVSRYSDDQNQTSYSGKRREFIVIDFNSNLLSEFTMTYMQCAEAEYLEISSKLDSTLPPDKIEYGGPVAYCPVWEPNMKITSNNCLHDVVFLFKTIPSKTVNNTVYKDIIYSSYTTSDSSLTNPYFYRREIYFAKNVGIIKCFEISKYWNVHRSYSLIRHKVIQ